MRQPIPPGHQLIGKPPPPIPRTQQRPPRKKYEQTETFAFPTDWISHSTLFAFENAMDLREEAFDLDKALGSGSHNRCYLDKSLRGPHGLISSGLLAGCFDQPRLEALAARSQTFRFLACKHFKTFTSRKEERT